MRSGWVKFYVQTLDNPVWQRDPFAWRVFEYLLLRAYDDKTQPLGKLVTSRYQIAEAIGGNHNTVFKALNRLVFNEMITIAATNKRSVISICNWEKYQSNGNQSSNNKVTTKQQQSNSLYNNKDIRNKNIILSNTNVLLAMFEPINPSFERLFANKTQRSALERLVTTHGEEKIKQVLTALPGIVSQEFAPRITTPLQLEAKLGELVIFMKQEKNKKNNGKYEVSTFMKGEM